MDRFDMCPFILKNLFSSIVSAGQFPLSVFLFWNSVNKIGSCSMMSSELPASVDRFQFSVCY